MDQFDSRRPNFQPYGLTCVRWKPSLMGRPDYHNEAELNLLTKGSVSYLLGGSKVTLAAGQMGLFWAAIPHQVIEYADATEYFVVTIPFAWFLQFKLPEPLVRPLLGGALIYQSLADRLPAEAVRFAQWESDLETGQNELRAIVLLELQARLRRLSRSQEIQRSAAPIPASAGSATAASLSKAEQIACLIAQRYQEPLTAQTIGSAVGLHPNYAMSLFKRTFGATLVQHLTSHRVSHAQRLLVTTDDKILSIAVASGFNTLSRFNEAFRRACGCSPREYRQSRRA